MSFETAPTFADAEKYVGMEVSGWTCSCGKCSGLSGVVVKVEENPDDIDIFSGRGFFTAYIGHEVGSDHSWQVGLFPWVTQDESMRPKGWE